MRRFYTLAGVRDISDKEIRVIRRKANSGDPVACYQLAQLEMAWHWEDNYAEYAEEIEKYHLPTYRKLSASENNEDSVSIDGSTVSFKQLTAIASLMITLGNTDGLHDDETNMVVIFLRNFVTDEGKQKELICNAIEMNREEAVEIIKGLDQTTKQGISNAMSLIMLADGDISDSEAAMFMELMFDCGIPDPTTQEWLNWLSRDNN